MSVTSIIFVECAQGKTFGASEKIKKIGGVREAYQVTGIYDIITIVMASNMRVLSDVVIKKIQKVPGVTKTVTNIVIG